MWLSVSFPKFYVCVSASQAMAPDNAHSPRVSFSISVPEEK